MTDHLTDREGSTYVSIMGVLPLSMAGFIMEMMGARYPDSMIKNVSGGFQLVIPNTSIYEYDNPDFDHLHDAAQAAADVMSTPETEAFLNSVGSGGITAAMPEWFTQMIYALGSAIFGFAPDCNRFTVRMDGKNGMEDLLVTISRPGADTTEKLHDDLRREIEQLKGFLEMPGVTMRQVKDHVFKIKV